MSVKKAHEIDVRHNININSQTRQTSRHLPEPRASLSFTLTLAVGLHMRFNDLPISWQGTGIWQGFGTCYPFWLLFRTTCFPSSLHLSFQFTFLNAPAFITKSARLFCLLFRCTSPSRSHGSRSVSQAIARGALWPHQAGLFAKS